jgi:riboflavin synthase
MFTGLVQAVGEVVASQARGAGRRLSIRADLAAALKVGDSVAVEGVCLTAAAVPADGADFDVSAATADRTTLGRLRPGDYVNLELPLAAAGLLGGHIVQGHVDGVGTVAALDRRGDALELAVALPDGLARYVVPQGSWAAAGISLTASSVADGVVRAAIIPHTYHHTTLQYRRPGDGVNVEVDILAKYVERLLGPADRGLTAERLARLGFAD